MSLTTLSRAALLASVAFVSVAAYAAPSTPHIDAREARQHARIQQGVASGELTRKETHRLRAEQRAIRGAERVAKADGVVTRGERRTIRAMQNGASADIHRQKHDAQTHKP